jgi:ureidoacrylate peracid hydrolase
MELSKADLSTTALLLGDLQNDFIDAKGAYGRAGQSSPEIAALPGRLKPLLDVVRAKGGLIVATQFTLVAGREGEPIISTHLKRLRPFLKAGDFAAGSWGNSTVDLLQPVDVAVEKISYSAFYMSRLEWVLRKLGVTRVIVSGIVTNGGVTSTVRDAHVRDIETTVLEDGCAAFSANDHATAIQALQSISRVATIAEMIAEIDAV